MSKYLDAKHVNIFQLKTNSNKMISVQFLVSGSFRFAGRLPSEHTPGLFPSGHGGVDLFVRYG